MTVISKGTILSFGEILLRMVPDTEGSWLRENKLPFYVGGAELNVANALALWGLPVRYLTAMPQNGLSEQITTMLGATGIDTSAIQYTGNRIGLYYLTRGKDIKHNALIYDRAGSAFAGLQTGAINWDEVLDGVTWLHFSAICPAISQNVADVCLEMLQAASQKNIFISVDLNYRSRLWQYGKQPVEVMPQLVGYCDLVMGNIWAAEKMLGIPVDEDIVEKGQKGVYLDQSGRTSQAIIERFTRCKAVANTFRFDVPTGLQYYTTLYTDGRLTVSSEYHSGDIVDKVGSGDCFMSGLIYGFYKGLSPEQTLEFATAAAFDKLFIEGDATSTTAGAIKEKAGLNITETN